MLEQEAAGNKTAAKRMPEGRRFPKGRSANPGGRPRSFASYIREQTRDGQEIVDMAVGIMRNNRSGGRLRLQAGEFLTERAWGKAEQTTVIRTDEEAKRLLAYLDAAALRLFGEEGRLKLELEFRSLVLADAALAKRLE